MVKKVKATREKYYPSREAGGQSCNISPIYEEMALAKVSIYLLNSQKYYLEYFSRGMGRK